MSKWYKLKDNVNIKDLEKYRFETFMNLTNTYLIAVRDSTNEKCKIGQFYRLGVNEKERTFHKAKYRGGGKCLLSVNVTRKDVEDLIKANMVEVVEDE